MRRGDIRPHAVSNGGAIPLAFGSSKLVADQLSNTNSNKSADTRSDDAKADAKAD